jgi:hypothetical protein
MLSPLLLVLRLAGTVDRVEGDWVVVEWHSGNVTDLPTSTFERTPREGESMSLRLQPRVRGAALAIPGRPPRLATDEGLLSLPDRAGLRPGLRYSLRIRLPREPVFQPPTTPVQEDKTHAKEDP